MFMIRTICRAASCASCLWFTSSPPVRRSPARDESALLRVNQIKKGVQENPDQIDKVPVQAGYLDRVVVVGGKLATPCLAGDDRHQPQTDDHVNGMNAGHREIEEEERLGL